MLIQGKVQFSVSPENLLCEMLRFVTYGICIEMSVGSGLERLLFDRSRYVMPVQS